MSKLKRVLPDEFYDYLEAYDEGLVSETEWQRYLKTIDKIIIDREIDGHDCHLSPEDGCDCVYLREDAI